MGKYHVFLSCKGEVLIDDKNIPDFLNKFLNKGCTIECINHKDINLTKEDLDDLKESSIYIVDTHQGFDEIAYWELGYAMGKGLKVIGYHNGESDMKIPPDIEELINIPSDIKRFVTKIDRAFAELKPKECALKDDWDKQLRPSQKETEAAL